MSGPWPKKHAILTYKYGQHMVATCFPAVKTSRDYHTLRLSPMKLLPSKPQELWSAQWVHWASFIKQKVDAARAVAQEALLSGMDSKPPVWRAHLALPRYQVLKQCMGAASVGPLTPFLVWDRQGPTYHKCLKARVRGGIVSLSMGRSADSILLLKPWRGT